MEGRPPSRSFRDVLVWQKARKWVAAVYRYTSRFHAEERFGMTAQLRDAAVSVSNNFAEGFKRRKTREKSRFYNVSQASLEESRGLLILSGDLGYGNPATLLTDAEEIARMLGGYMRSMVRRAASGRASCHTVSGSGY